MGAVARKSRSGGFMRAILVTAGTLLVVAGLRSAWQTASSSQGLDFYQFWIGGQEAPHERGALWSPETAKRLGKTTTAR